MGAIISPDLILPELGNILWKKVRRGEIPSRVGRQILGRVSDAPPVTLHASQYLLPLALTIATGMDRTVYDSLYLALAYVQDSMLVTADRRLVNALQGSPLARPVAWVGNPPE